MMRIRIDIDGLLVIQIATRADGALKQFDALLRHGEDAIRVKRNPLSLESCPIVRVVTECHNVTTTRSYLTGASSDEIMRTLRVDSVDTASG